MDEEEIRRLKSRLMVLAAGLAVVWFASSAFAHHSTTMYKMASPGDSVTCTGGAAKSGAPAMLSSLSKLDDGRMIKS